MNFKKNLVESPFVGQSTQFSLDTDEGNHDTVDRIMSRNPVEVYEEDAKHIFARYGSDVKGEIVWIDKIEQTIEYYVEFKNLRIKGIKDSLTQTKVWRSLDLPKSGFASTVFFDILFTKHDVIVSDSDQTTDGRDFWKRQLAIGHSNGYFVGLYDEDEWTIDWCSPDESFPHWRKESYPEGWSTTDRDKEKYRFIISKHKF